MSILVMGRAVSVVLIVLLWANTSQLCRADQPDWHPQKTWVIIVGVLEWQQSDIYSGFPKEGRRDAQLAELFLKKGVPQAQLLVLKDRQATRAQMRSALSNFLKPTRPDDLLVFYYAGHGVRQNGTTFLANYDITADTAATGLAVGSVVDSIEHNFHGSHALLTADCCHSGELGIEAAKRRGKISYASLTSVQHVGTSTGRWTFSDCMLNGFQGSPLVDANADGNVSLDELAKFTEEEMAFAEGQLSSFVPGHGFNSKLKLAAVHGPHPVARRKRVEVKWKGDWWPAYVLASQEGSTHVHYAGFGPEWDEWVSPDRIRQYSPKIYPAGTAFNVLSKDKWWPATVKESRSGLHKIGYTGFGPEWDEWVGPKRIRLKP